jgi:hypothetical protein
MCALHQILFPRARLHHKSLVQYTQVSYIHLHLALPVSNTACKNHFYYHLYLARHHTYAHIVSSYIS